MSARLVDCHHVVERRAFEDSIGGLDRQGGFTPRRLGIHRILGRLVARASQKLKIPALVSDEVKPSRRYRPVPA